MTTDAQKESERILLARYAPPGVLLNANFDILQFRGNTGHYLAPAPGRATLNALKMLGSLNGAASTPIARQVMATLEMASRAALTIRVSSDHGATWRSALALSGLPAAYSDLVQIDAHAGSARAERLRVGS